MVDRSNLPPAVIIGIEENGLGVARPLAKLGVSCIGLATPSWHPSNYTNSCRIVRATAWTKEAVIADMIRIGRGLKARAPVLITKDEPVLWFSEARDELEPYFVLNLPDPETVNLLMDKQRFTELARREGWPVPLTWFINSREELQQHLGEIVYPCILKPAVKNSVFRSKAPKKAWRLTEKDELIATYEMVAQWEKEVVVQEWIEGGDERVAYCLTYYNRDSQPLALFAGRKLRQWPIECGNTAIAEPAPKDWAGGIIDLTDSIFRKVGYRGLGSIEYKMRPGTDKPVIMEPTVGRTNYQNEIAVLNGQNIPAISYFDLAGAGVYHALSTVKRVKLIDGSAERKAAMKYYHLGQMTLGRWFSDRRGSKKYMRFRAYDPGPYLASVYMKARATAGRAVRTVLGQL